MGKPTARNGAVRLRESIAQSGHTRGTETSKYPEEEKENSIPQVAASETGLAQTRKLASWGCRTLLWSYKGMREVKRPGKARHRG